MKANEFCYWLQGYFEIGSGLLSNVLSGVQVKTIRAHLDLVRRVDPEHDNMFVSWLDMYLGRITTDMNSQQVATVKRLLASQFKHVIDPSYGGDGDELAAIHGQGHTPPIGEPIFRC